MLPKCDLHLRDNVSALVQVQAQTQMIYSPKGAT